MVAVNEKQIDFYLHLLAVGSFSSLIAFRGLCSCLISRPPFTSLRSVYFTHLSAARHKKRPYFAPSLPLISVITYAKNQRISNGLFPLNATNLFQYFQQMNSKSFFTLKVEIPSRSGNSG
jgi:hypothetical protein